MKPTVRATCVGCGDVELEIIDVTVRQCVDNGAASYQFRCPSCSMSTVKPADPRIVDVLVAAGVPLIRWKLPSELFERHEGHRFTHDDMLDFHVLLDDPSDPWWSALVQGVIDLD